MNPTIAKFGWPHTLVCEFTNWLVLAAKSDATAFGELPGEAHAELKQVTSAIEAALARAVGYARLNYLMLMMVDPQVHFHVIPRYEGTLEWNLREFVDVGWPRLPDLGHAVALEGVELEALTSWLKGFFD